MFAYKCGDIIVVFFLKGYKEYLLLTQKMEAMHREVTELTKHFNSLPRNSTEVRVSLCVYYVHVLLVP